MATLGVVRAGQAEGFVAVVEVVDLAEVPYVVVGSTAAAGWGFARMTQDVDLVLLAGSAQARSAVDALRTDVGLHVPDPMTDGSFSVLHLATGGKVDVFVPPPGDAFTRSRIERRVTAEIDGVGCFVATADDVVLAKLRRRLESRSERQWRDCVEMAATQDLDLDYMARWATELGVDDDLDDLLAAVRRG